MMTKLPQPFFAIVLAFFGGVIALCVLYHQGGENAANMGVLGIAAALVSGALGAFAGHATANNNPVSNVTMGNDRGTITPNDAK